MRIDIITAVPALLDSPFAHSIMKRAQDKGFLEIHVHNLHDYSKNKYRQVDDYQFGGGAGMVMMIEPIDKCIEKLKSERDYDCVIYMTPDGQQWTQSTANTFSMYENIIILCGHYKGIDERVRELHITHEISIGDYVISGGELAAAIVADSIVRLIPGVLGDEQSALSDSHQDGLLSPPIYTRPVEYRGLKVPDVLMSGNHSAIEKWRAEEALRRTRERRPDMLEGMGE